MPRTVLIADESITIRSVAESLLRGESFSVHSAADGQMALDIARAERPDLALVGEKLSGLSGAEVCEALKNDPGLRTIPIILMRADRGGLAPEHADAILTKPFSPQSLLDAVHRILPSETEHEGTTPVHLNLHASGEPGLEEELIDQALGLDDVGSAPAEELELGPVRSHATTGTHDDSAPGLGLVDDLMNNGARDESEEERMSKALDESFGIATPEPAPLPQPEALEPVAESDRLEFEPINRRDSADFELDSAIDAAFGASRDRSNSKKSEPALPDASSLHEVSLGDTGITNEPTGAIASSARPGAGLDLGSTGSVDEVQDRPHDYDWFIKEMQQDKSAAPQRPSIPEPPRIEPLVPKASSASPAASKVEARPEAPRKAYDEFITEFRAEIARLEGMAPAPSDAFSLEDTGTTRHTSSGKMAFEQTGDRPYVATPPPVPPAVPPSAPAQPATVDASIRAWGNELIDSVTSQVARELAAKIDSKVIYNLIEQKLKEVQKNKI